MRAAVLHAPRGDGRLEDLRIEEVPAPTPGDGELLVAIATCGVCASDLHVVQGVTPTGKLPIILGHEGAGRVAGVGPGVTGWAIGDRVLVPALRWCGRCSECHAGRTNRCRAQQILSVSVDGALAGFVAARADQVERIPDQVPDPQASIIADAVATPYRALKRAGVQAGETVVVIGLGGLGMHALALARRSGASVIGVDVDATSLERALAWGAEHVVDGSDPSSAARTIRRLTGGGADRSLEFVGAPSSAALSMTCLRPAGVAVLVGIGRDRLLGPPQGAFVANELEVRGSFGQTAEDVREVMAMAAAGEIDLGRSVSHELPLEDLPSALRMLETRSGDPLRIIIRL